MESKFWSVERHGPDGTVAVATHANPPRHTLTAAGLMELHAVLDGFEGEGAPRVLVLTGGDDGVFVAHYEVGELAEASSRQQGSAPADADAPRLHAFHRLCLRLEAMDTLTIAALNGHAAGGGLELALACDFRLVCDGDYRFGLPETSVGIIPGAGGTQRLARLVGTARALDLVLHARLVDPSELEALGLAHRRYAASDFAREVRAFADDLAARAPVALAQAKRAIRRGAEAPTLEAGLAIEQTAFERTMATQDAAGAMKAFLRGEPWEWRGR